ncbi:hypothetical protein BDB01DRAFT_795617 [Pilobolus umbonatus]|nr:hypothetical protein BDB01DRAFT_795617 [Pilobolus umbonatus]
MQFMYILPSLYPESTLYHIMDIQSLLCPQSMESINFIEVKDVKKIVHVNPYSWSTYRSFSPLHSPASTSSYLSVFPSPVTSYTPSPVQSHEPHRSNHGHPHTRIPWSPEEDKLLQYGYSQGLSWAMISTVHLPHRSRGCCWGRFKTLQSKSLEQQAWSDSEDRLLLLAIKKNSGLFKQVWKSVAHEMGTRNWKECELRSTKISNSSIKKKH